jgi:hypothetical protein
MVSVVVCSYHDEGNIMETAERTLSFLKNNGEKAH